MYYFMGTPSYTWYNFWINFLASLARMICAFVSLNCMVKGLAGPTSAIIQTNSIVQIIMNALFLAMIPTLMQAAGALIAIGGVVILILFK